MGNLCSIYHAHFDKLFALTNNYNKAVFLDKCLFWWQISTYTLNDQKKWFTRPIATIAKELNLSISSVNRYLKDFRNEGLIESKNILLKKKHLYLRITDKLLMLMGEKTQSSYPEQPIEKNTDKEPGCSYLPQDDIIENVNLNFSIYKEQDNNHIVTNNTVSQLNAVNNQPPKTTAHPIFPSYPIEEVIGERLTIREKNYIKGMMHNLQKHTDVLISAPEQLFAEIAFSVLNDAQLQGITNFNHKVQIIAKLLRQKRWLTPKGFYNHADFGAPFRKRPAKSDVSSNRHKGFNGCGAASQAPFIREQQLAALKKQFNAQGLLNATQTQQLHEVLPQLKGNPGSIALVHSITATLVAGYHEQQTLFMDIHAIESELCATASSFERDGVQNMMQKRVLLEQQEAQLRALTQTIFEVFCDISKQGASASDVDRAYMHYEALNSLLTCVEKSIRDIEIHFDEAYVA